MELMGCSIVFIILNLISIVGFIVFNLVARLSHLKIGNFSEEVRKIVYAPFYTMLNTCKNQDSKMGTLSNFFMLSISLKELRNGLTLLPTPLNVQIFPYDSYAAR